MEGGAYGHMLHPYEDLSLSFSDLHTLVNRALIYGLDTPEHPVTEKTDGQNIMFTVRDGTVRFARNTSHIKNNGEAALSADELRAMFVGRGDIEHTFGQAGTDLQAAMSAIAPHHIDQIFANGSKFMSAEIIHQKSENVIPYGKNIIVLHHTIEYDSTGKQLSTSADDATLLSSELKDAQKDSQSEYSIQGQHAIILDASGTEQAQQDADRMIRELQQFMASYDLTDDSTIQDFLRKRWSDIIDRVDTNGILTGNDRVILLNRIVNGDKSIRLNKLSSFDAMTVAKQIEETAKQQTFDILRPLQVWTSKLGILAIKRAVNLLSDSNPVAGEAIEQKLATALNTIRTSDDVGKLNAVNKFIALFNDLEVDRIVPSEGLVFQYNGKIYKFTGAFSPINRILGAVKYDSTIQTPITSSPTSSMPTPVVGSTQPTVVYTGRFQPYHKGHHFTYEALVKKYGKNNVYITSTNKTDATKSPFTFEQKKHIMTSVFNIPSDRILQVTSPYNTREIQQQLNIPDSAPVIMAVGEKDSERMFSIGKRYYRPITNEILVGAGEATYVDVIPQVDIKIGDNTISGTEIRNIFINGSAQDITELTRELYGDADATLIAALRDPIVSAHKVAMEQEYEKRKKFDVSKAKELLAPYLNHTITNPETQNKILIATAIKYDRHHPAFKAAQDYLKQFKITI